MQISQTEENYLKAIFKIAEKSNKAASTNSISKEMSTRAASVTDMLKRLSEKKLINYKPYKGVTLTNEGLKIATALIRRHRLWEVFLVEKLNFNWDEVHEIAEQLEHIKSDELCSRLDAYLEFPKFDPHGDPIPDEDGNFAIRKQVKLTELNKGDSGIVIGVEEHSTPFLKYLDRLGITLGSSIKVVEKFAFDGSIKIILNEKNELTLTQKVGQNLFIQKN